MISTLVAIVVVGGVPAAAAATGWLIGWATGLDGRFNRKS